MKDPITQEVEGVKFRIIWGGILRDWKKARKIAFDSNPDPLEVRACFPANEYVIQGVL